jgi:hypothetical protein
MRTTKAPSGRPKRQPVGTRNRLSVTGKDENYVYRFVNDIGDRVHQFQEGGYEIVTKEHHKVGDNRVDVASSEGTVATISVGVRPDGQAQRAVLMRINREWYDEDQEAKLADIKETQRQLKNPTKDGETVADFGDLKIS